MIMCYNMFVKNKTPKFLEVVLKTLGLASHACFYSRADLDIFISDMRKLLEKDSPAGTSYTITDYKDPTGANAGQISIERKGIVDSSVARIQYADCFKIFRWMPGSDGFINVMYRVED